MHHEKRSHEVPDKAVMHGDKKSHALQEKESMPHGSVLHSKRSNTCVTEKRFRLAENFMHPGKKSCISREVNP